MTAAEMELIVKANVQPATQGISSLNQSLNQTKVSAVAVTDAVSKASTGINQITTSATKASSALSQQAKSTATIADATNDAATNASKLAGIVDSGANEIISSNNNIAKSYDDIEASVNSFADAFNAKWNPIIDEAQKAAQAFEQIPQSAQQLNQAFVNNNLSQGLAAGAIAAGALDSSIDQLVSQSANILKLNESVRQLLLSIDGLDPAIREFAQTGQGSIAQLTAAFTALRQKANFTTDPGQLLKYNAALEQLGKQINTAKNAAQNFTTPLSKINPAANTATFAVTNFGRVLQDLPFGFIGIANNLNPLLESFQRLAAESKATGTSLTKNLLGALAGGGGIGFAISAITSAISLATIGFSAWTRGMGSAKNAMDDLTQSTENYKKALDDADKGAIASSQKQITSLQLLVKAAQDNTASLTSRTDAVIKLQSLSPEYFGTLSKEKILYGDLTNAINQTTDALINRAFGEAAANKAAEAGGRVFELIEKRKAALVSLTIAQESFNRAIANTQIGQGIVPYTKALNIARDELNALNDQFFQAQLEQESFLAQAHKYTTLSQGVAGAGETFKGVAAILKELDDAISIINKKTDATGQAFNSDRIAAYKKAIDDLLKTSLMPSDSTIQGLIAKVKALGGTFDEEGKKIETVASILAGLKSQELKLDIKADVENVDVIPDKIKAIQTAIEKLREIKVSPNSEVIIDLKARINDFEIDEAIKTLPEQINKGLKLLKNIDIVPPPIEIPVLVDFTKADADFAQLKGKVEVLSAILKIDLPINFQSLNEAELKKLADKLQATFDKIKKKSENLAEEVGDAMTQQFTDMAGNITQALGEGIGKVVAGEGFKGLFSGIFSTLAEGVKALGESFIKLGITLQLAKLAFQGPTKPLQLIAAGIGLEILGSLISSKIAQFGEGGVVTAPMLGIVGERGKEAVIPLDRLHEFIQVENNHTGGFVASTKISGQDLLILLERAGKHNRRTY